LDVDLAQVVRRIDDPLRRHRTGETQRFGRRAGDWSSRCECLHRLQRDETDPELIRLRRGLLLARRVRSCTSQAAITTQSDFWPSGSAAASHQHLAVERLITTLANTVDTARDQHRDIVLAELSVKPIEPAPPVKLATRDRPLPHRRSRGG
jgi:hypothetical protein